MLYTGMATDCAVRRRGLTSGCSSSSFTLSAFLALLDASGSLYIPRPHKQPREKERPRPLCPSSSSSSGLRGPLRVFYTLAAKRLRRGLRETRGSISGTSKRMRPSHNQPLDVILFLPPQEDTVYRDRCLCIAASLLSQRQWLCRRCHAQYMKKAYLRSHRESRSV